jgi:site-specific DNA-methyltransferase (adenine-specific)
MKLYSENDSYKIYNGDMLDMLQVIKPESIDAIVCDPPYELGFMNKSWDSTGIAFKKETWQNCFEVLKPGGYLLAFGGSRTYHRIACVIEDAGFEIRDCVMYLYGCGFSKSYNIGLAIDKKNGVDNRTGNIRTDGVNNQNICYDFKAMKPKFEERIAQNEWQGWGTCLKPAYEPVIVARKPFKSSVVDNIIKYRVGGINIDGCKIGNEKRTQFSGKSNGRIYSEYSQKNAHFETVEGRFPANVITDGSEEVAKGMPNTTSTPIAEESAMRYFYSAKASKKDRDEYKYVFISRHEDIVYVIENLKDHPEDPYYFEFNIYTPSKKSETDNESEK